MINTVANKVQNGGLIAFKHGTSRVFNEVVIINKKFWVHVAQKDGLTRLRLDMNSCLCKISVASNFRDLAGKRYWGLVDFEKMNGVSGTPINTL